MTKWNIIFTSILCTMKVNMKDCHLVWEHAFNNSDVMISFVLKLTAVMNYLYDTVGGKRNLRDEALKRNEDRW